jgi:hypothetical protein
VSAFRDAQQWLTEHALYPAPGLADVAWSPNRELLAVLSLDRRLLLFGVQPPAVLWVSERGIRSAGFELLDDRRLVCYRFAEPSASGAAEAVAVEVTEEEAEGAQVRTISVASPCRTYGMSGSGRFLLLAARREASESSASLDLGRWHETPPGNYEAELLPIIGLDLEPNISFAWLAEGARKLVVREANGGEDVDWFIRTTMGNAHPNEPRFRRPDHRNRLPRYPWALPSYLWSPDGHWFAARIREELPDGWDEVPVGGPSLSSYVAAYDGETGDRLWSHEVETVHCPFEWTPGGLLEAGEQIWDPSNGESLGPAQ